MSSFGNKGPRILFGVPEGDYYARQFIAVASAMPEVKCKFLGFSWSTGLVIRKAGLNYSHIPWFCRVADMPYSVPPVAEYASQGYLQHSIPDRSRKAFAALGDFIGMEIEKFSPDIVVYGPLDHSICYLMDKDAYRRNIARLGIQPSFLSNHFIVHSQGENWIECIRAANVSNAYERKSNSIIFSTVNSRLRRVSKKQPVWDLHLWIRGIESGLRVVSGGTTFYTHKSLASLFTSKIAKSVWFPHLKALESLEETPSGFVLVALNQPALTSWDSPNWIDLITLALEATPEDISIVIRPHPSELARELPKELEKTLLSRGARISRAGSGPSLESIIQHCRAVMTLNSSAGMEALIAGKLVFTLISTFYVRPGLARHITTSDVSKVREMLINSEQFRPVAAEINKFTAWLIDNWLVSSPLVDGAEGKKLLNRIRRLVSQIHPSN